MRRWTSCVLLALFLLGSHEALARKAHRVRASHVPPPVCPAAPSPTPVLVYPATPAPAPTFAFPSLIKIEHVGPLKMEAVGAGSPQWSYAIPILGPIISGLIAFVGVLAGLKIAERNTRRTIEASQKANAASIWQKANETEIRDIQSKLDSFYFPYLQLAKANHQFAQDVRVKQADPNYRLLIYLFDEQWKANLAPGDKKLIEYVCCNAGVLEKFINEKATMVDMKLLKYLSRATAHFRILQAAYKSELGADASRFSKYVYPIQLDGVLELEVRRLKRRMEILRENPDSRPPPEEALEIPENLDLEPWADPGLRIREEAATA